MVLSENWKPVVDYEGLYEVSDRGRVLSHHKSKPRILKPATKAYGRQQLSLYRDGSCESRNVHRLVLHAFVGPCPDEMEGCHNNGNAADNRLTNLRWDTHENNLADKPLHDTDNRGAKHWAAKLEPKDVRRMRALRRKGLKLTELAKVFDVSPSTVGAIVRRKRWKHIK